MRNWQFALSFFGALVLGVAALAARATYWRSPATWLVAAGVGLYLCAFLITIGLNVPSTRSWPPTPTWPSICSFFSDSHVRRSSVGSGGTGSIGL